MASVSQRASVVAIVIFISSIIGALLAPVVFARPVVSLADTLTEDDLRLLRLSSTNETRFTLPDSHLTWSDWDLHCTETELACEPEHADSTVYRNCSYRSSAGCNLQVLGLEEVVDLSHTRQYNLSVNVLHSGSTYFYCYSGHVACEYATGRMAIRYYYDTCAGSLHHCVQLNATT